MFDSAIARTRETILPAPSSLTTSAPPSLTSLIALATRDPDAARAALDGLDVDYVAVADYDPPVLAAAVRVGSTRLIDNVPLEGGQE